MPSPDPTDDSTLSGSMKLVEITCELGAQHELDDILRTVTVGACEALDCERASLFLVDHESQELFTRTVTRLEIKEIRFPLASGIAGWVAREKLMLHVPEPYSDERFNQEFDQQTGFRTRNILAAPVVSRHDGRVVGVLQILNKNGGPFTTFDERLLEAFAAHAANALERHKLLEEAKRSQELQLAIDMGRQIQASFLPSRLPEVPGYEIAAWWQPAESVSGDYYDVFQLPDGRLGLIVADVSGHGVGPSLIMASVRAMLHVMILTRSEPDEILQLLSRSIYDDLQDSRFITVFMAALDPRAHKLEFANAGHGPVLHYRRETGVFDEMEASGLPVGVLEEDTFPCATNGLVLPGDVLLLMTDGAWELSNAGGEMFGVERLTRIVEENPSATATELLEIMREQIISFHPDQLPPDDVTLILLKRTPASD